MRGAAKRVSDKVICSKHDGEHVAGLEINRHSGCIITESLRRAGLAPIARSLKPRFLFWHIVILARLLDGFHLDRHDPRFDGWQTLLLAETLGCSKEDGLQEIGWRSVLVELHVPHHLIL